MNRNEQITKSAGLVGALTFLSRIAGYLRDVVIAYFFGAGYATDAFWVAFRIPNLLRRLFAEGSLTISFIPVFTEQLEQKDKEEAKKVSDSVFTLLFILLLVITALGVIFSPFIVKLFASGFDEETFRLTVYLNRFMFPYLFFISLTALSMGILNSLRHFFAPAFSPVLFNIAIVLTIILMHSYFNIPIHAAAIGVIIGGILQLAFQLPFLSTRGYLFSFSKSIWTPAVKRIALLMLPQLFGIAVYNLNILVNTQYASYMPEGTVSYLYFAERLIEFPLGIFAVSVATVLLPNLSSLISRGEMDKFKETYVFTLRLVLFILIPALCGLIALREPICNLLYQHGEFSAEAMVYTSQALLGYAFGLWAVGGIRITAPAFYAMQDTKTPVVIALIAFVANAAIGFVLGFKLGMNHTGLAVASSVSSILNFILLLYLLEKKTPDLGVTGLFSYCMKILVISLITATVAWSITQLTQWTTSELSAQKFILLFGSIFVSGGLYFLLAKLLSIDELHSIMSLLKKRKLEQ